ncbi:nodulation S family protein [Devosia ginsengisoli]|nr:nodulation S family protein [Devosia ginsengisoli]
MDTRQQKYEELLFAHLADREAGEVRFFVNERRFDIMRQAFADQLAGKSVLNIASGPFAMEFYLSPDCARIDSIDIDACLAPLHARLIEEELIAPSSFAVCDVMAFEPERQYDVIVVNDMFYTKHVDFYAVMEKYAPFLKPGGQLYFDILDRRAGPLWSLFNKDSRYRRYDMADVHATLQQHGFAVEASLPSLGIKGGMDRAIRSLLWHTAGVANNIIFLCRKGGAALAFAGAMLLGEPLLQAY